MALHFCQNPAEITVAQKFENKKLYQSSWWQLIETLQNFAKSGVLYTIRILDITGEYHLIQILRKKHHYRIDPVTYSTFTGTVYSVGKCRQEVCLNNTTNS